MKLLMSLTLLIAAAHAGLLQHHGHATSYQNVHLESHGAVPIPVKSEGHSAAILSHHDGAEFEASHYGGLEHHGFGGHHEDFSGFEGQAADYGGIGEHAGLGGYGGDAELHF